MYSPEIEEDSDNVAEKYIAFETRYNNKVSQHTGLQQAHSIVVYE
jgi:hypothetical protein